MSVTLPLDDNLAENAQAAQAELYAMCKRGGGSNLVMIERQVIGHYVVVTVGCR